MITKREKINADFQFGKTTGNEQYKCSDPLSGNKKNSRRNFILIALLFNLFAISQRSIAQTTDTLLSTGDLKKLSLEDLMNIEITSVSKHPEKLINAASAIQVITQEDIRSSGAKTLPEALRLAPNLQVAQVNASQWAISARGFDNVLSNKLLVLIDGRTVYTPLYAGVFWDVQNIMLEDVDRIEVISGPGGTLWGANAVNGVINIIMKSSRNTQGLYAEGSIGTIMPGSASLRYGGKITDKLTYRAYVTGFKMGSTSLLSDSTNAKDQWTMVQGGFRFDWNPSEKNKVSLQSDIYDGRPNPDGGTSKPVIARGDNMVARWNHTISEKADFQLQAYYDYTWRDFRNGFTENLNTYDIDWQNRYKLGKRNIITYGLGARLMDHKVNNLQLFEFVPEHKLLHLFSAFVQDELMLIKDRLRFTIGSKIEHNSYTGFEFSPNGKLTWTPSEHHTIWTAVSRAVRTPARIDRDFVISLAPNLPLIQGSDLISETVIAYELGWRVQPGKNLSFSLSTFYNVYDNIRSAEPGPPPLGIPITFANGVRGETYGAELAATYQLTSWWHLRGGYTYLEKHLWVKPTSKDSNKGTAESDDPQNQFLLQSTMKLPGKIELGTVLRYVDKLPAPYVPDYFGLDVRIGWHPLKFVELDVVGQNLLYDYHSEFTPSSPSPRLISRSVYGKIIFRF